MLAELRPRQLLDEFFKRADAARQRDEGIGALEHQLLARVHILDDDEFIDVHEHLFARAEKFRDDAGDLAASAKHRFRDFAHQAEAAAAVDKANVGVGERLAELTRGESVSRVHAFARAAVNADAFDGFDELKSGRCGI